MSVYEISYNWKGLQTKKNAFQGMLNIKNSDMQQNYIKIHMALEVMPA